MAGEWIAVDLALPDKPEVQELIDTTGQPVEVVVFRLYRLWCWASMHCADGTARMTLPRLVRTCGGDDAFWRAVAAVGWLELDETAATVAVPGWDRRFSQAAKARRDGADRVRDHRERKKRAGTGYLSADQREAVIKRFDGRCVYCGIKRGQTLMGGRRAVMHVDHLVPVCNGGTNEEKNLVCACSGCNLEKGDRTLEDCGVEPQFLPPGMDIERDGNGCVTGVTIRETSTRYQKRGNERTRESPPPPREASQSGEAWQRLRAAWNAGKTESTRRRPWKPATAPDGVQAATGSPEALSAALEAVERLPACRYFTSPVTLVQFVRPGFIDRVLGGQYDEAKQARRPDGQESAPVKVDPAFLAAKAATEAREAARREAEHRRLDEQARKRECAGGAA